MGCSKTILRWKFIAIKSYLRKQEKSQMNHLNLHLSNSGRKNKKNPKVNRREEIIKIRSEINEKEMKETIAKINKIRNEKGEIITDTAEIKGL